MLRVYLDQNKWIDVMRALRGDPLGEPFRNAATMIVAAAESGQASFPLSTAHVFETWKARRAERRRPLARTMAMISRNHAIAPPWELSVGVNASVFDATAVLIGLITLAQLPLGLSTGTAAAVLILGPHGVAAVAAAGVLLSATGTVGGLCFAAWGVGDRAWCAATAGRVATST